MNTKKHLPKWLYEYIFDQLGSEEKPNPKEYCKNLDSDVEKNKVYLGTYFPRSFAESYCIHENLFNYERYKQSIKGKTKFSIFSVGCGTGGDVLGVLCAIANNLPTINEVEIVAYDGNNIAIDYLMDLTSLDPVKRRFNITSKCIPLPIICREDVDYYLNSMGDNYDLILSFKFVNELMDAGILGNDAFLVLAHLLASKLNDTGLLTLLDVTDVHLGVYQPKNLNRGLCAFSKAQSEFKTLLPIPCHFEDKKCFGSRCFTNKRFYGSFSFTDKVAYRVIGRADYVDYLYDSMKDGFTYSRNLDNEPCSRLGRGRVVDAYDINN